MNKEIKLGDYVKYVPDVRTSTKYKVGKRGRFFTTQIGVNSLLWRYMGLDDNGQILLIADRPTNDLLYLHGKDGYVNGSSKLNDLCNELYSSPLGKARSINVDDVNRVLGAKPVGRYYSAKHRFMDNHKNLTIGEIISKQAEPSLRHTLTPETGKDINDYAANYYRYEGTEYKESIADEYNLIFRNASHITIKYWLASSCVDAHFNLGYAGFNVRFVIGGRVNNYCMFDSYGSEGGDDYPVRPVVSLKSNIQFAGKSTKGVWQIG